MSVFVQQNGSECDFPNSDAWVVLSPIEQSIKRKIEAVGTPLKDWDINIYRGVLTGCNEAFIISAEKRNEILANCMTEDERARTAELIRPILRGRDIKRYGYDWAGLYLIATFPSRNYDIEQYPAVKSYLLSFADEMLREAGYDWVADNHLNDFCYQKLSQTGQFIEIEGKHIRIGNSDEKSRKKTNNKWFETQDSISYWEDFNKPKIMYSEIVSQPQFYLDENGQFIPEATTFIMTGEYLQYLYNLFHSRLITFVFKTFYAGGGLGGDGYRYKKAFIEKLPIPFYTGEPLHVALSDLKRKELNQEAYTLYRLNQQEIDYIENRYSQFRQK